MSVTGVLRLGEICVRVLDMDEARMHYGDHLGLLETARDGDDRTYYKAWDEHDCHSVVIQRSDQCGVEYVAFKVLDVEGERLPDSEASRSQDFIMVNDPTFNAPDAATFVKAFKPLAATTDRMEGFKKIFSTALRGVEMAVEAVGGESAKLKAFGGEPRRHILGETFFNQLPLRYGDNIAKLSLAPISEELKALTDKQLEDGDDPDALRSSVRSFFEQHSGEWEVRVQLCTNLTDMPIEKADAEWDEKQSPYLPVAILRAARQDSWPDQRATDIEDGLGFSPWNGVVEHWPLGSLNRIRKVVYEHSQQFRSERNRCPVHERKS